MISRAAYILVVLVSLWLASCTSIEEILEDDDTSALRPASPPPEGADCFQSFSAFKRGMKAQGKSISSSQQWHHIVEQTRNRQRFPNRLHCTDNVIAVPIEIHRKISAHYSSKQPWTKGKRVRDVISARSWQSQYQYGVNQLRKHGVSPP